MSGWTWSTTTAGASTPNRPKLDGEREYWESDNRPISYVYLEHVLGSAKPDLQRWQEVRRAVLDAVDLGKK